MRNEFNAKNIPSIIEDTMPVLELLELYTTNIEIDFLPVQNHEKKIVGYLQRQMFLANLSQNRFSRDLLLRPEVHVSTVMDKRVIVLDAYTNLSEASEFLMSREESIRFDPFVISHKGFFYGYSTVKRVIDGLNFYMRLDLQACESSQTKMNDAANSTCSSLLNYNYQIHQLKGPGGDYAGVFNIHEQLFLLVHLDVCGKGLKASNMAITAGSALYTFIEILKMNFCQTMNFNLQSAASLLNKILYELTPSEMYATGVLSLYNKETGILQQYDFGHGFSWIKRGKKIHNMIQTGNLDPSIIPFLGIEKDLKIKPSGYKVKPGDILISVSDGMIEQKNDEGEEWGSEGMLEIVKNYEGQSAAELNQILYKNWCSFRGNHRILDDHSIFAVIL